MNIWPKKFIDQNNKDSGKYAKSKNPTKQPTDKNNYQMQIYVLTFHLYTCSVVLSLFFNILIWMLSSIWQSLLKLRVGDVSSKKKSQYRIVRDGHSNDSTSMIH